LRTPVIAAVNRRRPVDVITDAGERTARITLPADELFVTAAHTESLLRIRLDERGDTRLTP
jgi:gluconolactonase